MKKTLTPMQELIPVRSYDEMLHAFACSYGYMDIYGIRTVNMNALSPYEQDYQILMHQKFLQSYEGEIKMVSVVFPVDLSGHREHLVRKHEQAADPYIQRILQEKLRELEKLEDKSVERDYYYMIFADDQEDMRKCQTRIETLLQMNIYRLTKEKKINVLRQINNQSSLAYRRKE